MNKKVYTVCYGNLSEYKNKNEAIKFYFYSLRSSVGAERERYLNIYLSLHSNDGLVHDDGEEILYKTSVDLNNKKDLVNKLKLYYDLSQEDIDKLQNEYNDKQKELELNIND